MRNGFKTSVDLYFAIKEPTYASRAQVTYIGDLFDKVFRAIRAKDGHDPQTGEYYADMIDLTSFATKLLVEDFTKNYDLLAGSQFFYKDRDDNVFACDQCLQEQDVWEWQDEQREASRPD